LPSALCATAGEDFENEARTVDDGFASAFSRLRCWMGLSALSKMMVSAEVVLTSSLNSSSLPEPM
jgi:hypothetical protein